MRRSFAVAAVVTLTAAAWSAGARAERPAVYDPAVQARMDSFQQRIDGVRAARTSRGQSANVTAQEVDGLQVRLGALQARHGELQGQLGALQGQLGAARQAVATRPPTRAEQLRARIAGDGWLARFAKSGQQRAEARQIAALEQQLAAAQTSVADAAQEIVAAKAALRDARVVLHGERTLDAMAARLNGRYQQRVGGAIKAFNGELPAIDEGLRYAEQWHAKYSYWKGSMRRNPWGDWGDLGDIEVARDAKGTAQNVSYVCAKLSAATLDLGAALSSLRNGGSRRERAMADALEAQLRPAIDARFDKCRSYTASVRGDLLLQAPPKVPSAKDVDGMLGR